MFETILELCLDLRKVEVFYVSVHGWPTWKANRDRHRAERRLEHEEPKWTAPLRRIDTRHL
jgi:hypothetical protein